MAAHIVTAVLVPFMLYVSSPGSSLFSYHPTLMTLAFLLLLPQAVLLFHRRSSWFHACTHGTKIGVHLVLQLLALVVGAVGVRCVYYHKERQGYPHYTSWHAWCGVACMVYMAAQCAGGAALNNWRRLSGFLPARRHLALYHATSGATLHTLSAAVVALGMCSSWYQRRVVEELGLGWVGWWCGAASVGLLLLTCLEQITGKYLPQTTATTTTTTTSHTAPRTTKKDK